MSRIICDRRDWKIIELPDDRRIWECVCGQTIGTTKYVEGKPRFKFLLEPYRKIDFTIRLDLRISPLMGRCPKCRQIRSICFNEVIQDILKYPDFVVAAGAEGIAIPAEHRCILLDKLRRDRLLNQDVPFPYEGHGEISNEPYEAMMDAHSATMDYGVDLIPELLMKLVQWVYFGTLPDKAYRSFTKSRPRY